MSAKTIKISEENYKGLLAIASDIQKEASRPISFDDTITLLRGKENAKKMTDMAGMWKMTEEEAVKLKKYVRKKLKSA